MTKKTIALILVSGAAIGGASLGLVACSSDPAVTPPGPDGSKGDTSTPMDDSGNADTSPITDAGSEAAPCKDPSLHAETTVGTIFCGYDEASAPFNCTTGTQCCLGGSLGGGKFAAETCATFGGVCDNPAPNKGTQIECGQTQDCTANDAGGAGALCCLHGAGVPAQVAGCSAADLKSSGGTSIKCEQPSACPMSDLHICATQAECGDAGVCTAFHWKIYSLGYCK